MRKVIKEMSDVAADIWWRGRREKTVYGKENGMGKWSRCHGNEAGWGPQQAEGPQHRLGSM